MSLCAEENAWHRICLYLHKMRGLMSSTSICSDVNHPLVPRLWHVPRGVGCTGTHPLPGDLGCSIRAAVCLKRAAAKQDFCRAPYLAECVWAGCTAPGVPARPPCFAPWNQKGNEMRLNILLRILSGFSWAAGLDAGHTRWPGWTDGRGWWHL